VKKILSNFYLIMNYRVEQSIAADLLAVRLFATEQQKETPAGASS
jgi:hypothetical protein